MPTLPVVDALLSRRMLAAAVLAFVGLGLVGCGDESIAWRIRFARAADRTSATHVVVSVRRDTCDGEAVHEERVASGVQPSAQVPSLEAGEWLFVASAVDDTCTEIAEDCQLIVLPLGQPLLLSTLEATSDPTPGCASGICVNGACVDGDAGPEIDAGAPDAGASDAGMGGPAPPRVLFPWNGMATGSSLPADDAELIDHPRLPIVRWEPVGDAAAYVLEIASCADVDPSTCDFTAPFQRRTVITTSARPTSPLEVSAVAPRGRRYGFRVGACARPDGTECNYSPGRYIDVGRLAQDLDGDGDGELLYIAELSGGGFRLLEVPERTSSRSVFVGPTYPDLTSEARWAGDYDGDGYGELILGTDSAVGGGFRFIDHNHIEAGSVTEPTPGADLGASMARVGDVNGDGYADFAVGAPGLGRGEIRVYFGGPSFAESNSTILRGPPGQTEFGLEIAAAGDRNGDGLADIAVIAKVPPTQVRVTVYAFPDETAVMLEEFSINHGAPTGMSGRLVSMFGGEDMDADGRPEIVVGQPYLNGVTVLFGDGVEQFATGLTDGLSGFSVSMGDMLGTGEARISAGTPNYSGSPGSFDGGAVNFNYVSGMVTIEGGLAWFAGSDPMAGLGLQIAHMDLDGDGRDDAAALDRPATVAPITTYDPMSQMVGSSFAFVLHAGGRSRTPGMVR